MGNLGTTARAGVLLAMSVAWLAWTPGAFAAAATADAKAAIVPPLSLVNTAPLSFGNLVPSAAAGTATVNEDTGVLTISGGVTAAGGTVSAAAFSGNAEDRSHIKIDVPNSITLSRVGGGASMTVNNFALNVDKNNWQIPAQVFSFQVGGRLVVGANQMAGTYTGTFTVTVNYR